MKTDHHLICRDRLGTKRKRKNAQNKGPFCSAQGGGLEGPWELADPHFACPGPTEQYDGCVRGESGPTMFWPLPATQRHHGSSSSSSGGGGSRGEAGTAGGDDGPTHVLSDAGGGSFTVGTLDETTEKFHPLRSVGANGSFSTAGGVQFSAAGQADDGRLLFVGWVGAGAPPAGGWSPLCIPPPNSSKSWLGKDCGVQMMSSVRELSWDRERQWLVANPTAELEQLRNRTLLEAHNRTRLPPGKAQELALPHGTGAAMDLSIVFELPPAAGAAGTGAAAGASNAGGKEKKADKNDEGAPSDLLLQFGVRVLGRGGPLVNITVSTAAAADGRRSSRLCRVSGPSGNGPSAQTPFRLLDNEDTLHVRILTDRSVAEFFVGGGRASRTLRHYPAQGDYSASLVATGDDAADHVVQSVEAYEMGCGWELP